MSLAIALIGYGRMGREIEKQALMRGHRIVARIDRPEDWQTYTENNDKADVAIEFSVPAAAAPNIEACFDRHLPVVVGTTGWYAQLPALKTRCQKEGQALFVASNFSIGVHLFFAAARFLTRRMENHPSYTARIEETHHIHKIDKPSGTAVSLAETVLQNTNRYQGYFPEDPSRQGHPSENSLPILSFREGEIPGIHRLFFDSPEDEIALSHRAKSRQGFATGAVTAAEWLAGKQGFFGMEDMLGF